MNISKLDFTFLLTAKLSTKLEMDLIITPNIQEILFLAWIKNENAPLQEFNISRKMLRLKEFK